MPAATTSIALAAIAGSAISKAGSAYSQSQALRAQGDYQRNINDQNARMAELQAQDAVTRGGKAAARVRQEGRRLVASQRVSYAGQGVDVGTGSAQDVQLSTLEIAAEDAITIKNNAWREAFGYRSQAAASRYRGRMLQKAARNEARSVLVGGVTDLFNAAGRSAYVAKSDGNPRVVGIE